MHVCLQALIDDPLRALIFDSYYDDYRGVICQFRVTDGEIRCGDRIRLMNTEKEFEVDELGVLAPHRVQVDCLFSGEVGYLAASIKQVSDARVGDTITMQKTPANEPLPGYAEARPMVYCGLFPTSADQYQMLRTSLDKLQLNDAALVFEPENSVAMGSGFRCGFLGLLHMEIVQERLEREYDLDLIITAPTVVYKCTTLDHQEIIVSNPNDLPEPQKRKSLFEPFCRVEIITPKDYVGPVMDLCQSRRGEYVSMQYLNEQRTSLVYFIPLAEVVTDFFDALKSRSKGYASMEYTLGDYRESDLVKLEIRINNEAADPLATIVHRDNAYVVGKELAIKLKELIPKQQFRVPIQVNHGHSSLEVCIGWMVGSDRVTGHCVGGHSCFEERCIGQMLRRRYYPQKEATEETGRREETHEIYWKGGDSARSLYGCTAGWKAKGEGGVSNVFHRVLDKIKTCSMHIENNVQTDSQMASYR